MRRIVLWLLSTLSAVVLLFGYHTSTSGPAAVGAGAGRRQPGHHEHHHDLRAAGGDASGTSTGGTVTGAVAQTRWGPVQVQLTTDAAGAITDVEVVQYPSGNREDEQINAYALPVLVQATLDAQSADIDMVSGATVTSEGYLQSLQSALDQA